MTTNGNTELVVLGPGYGESVLVGLGNGCWIAVDCCIDSESGEPWPQRYLYERGIDVSTAVKLVVATHWHDDHVRGLSKFFKACASADLVLPVAFARQEIMAFVYAYGAQPTLKVSSGVSELYGVLTELMKRDRRPIFALTNRRLKVFPGPQIGRTSDCEVWSLSPSDGEIARFLTFTAASALQPGATVRVIPPPEKNHTSVVLWVAFGEASLLLGSDLEETADPTSGWSGVLAGNQHGEKARVFKIPHHGSNTAHNERVWTEMLEPNPLGVVTPFRRGKVVLPGSADIQRILRYTDRAYLTCDPRRTAKIPRRPQAVEKTMRETAINMQPTELVGGWVRLFATSTDLSQGWEVGLSPNAMHISGARS